MTWRNPVTARRCDGKRPYRTENRAAKIAQQDSTKTGEYIVAYQCFDCHQYHVGHADLAQRIVMEQQAKVIAPTVMRIPIGDDGKKCLNPECPNGLPSKGLVYCTKNCKKRAAQLRKQKLGE